jgi:Uma2 family endonuclease
VFRNFGEKMSKVLEQIEREELSAFISPFTLRRFSVQEYHHIGKAGIFGEDERIELICGMIRRMSPIGSRHSACVSILNRKFRAVEGKAIVRIQDPIILDDETEPQPDIVIVKFKSNDYADSHPHADDVLLIIEVAETSLEEDRHIKLPRYADLMIPEVWIFNLIDNIVEIYSEPLILANGIPGYYTRKDFVPGEIINPMAFPDLEIVVPDLAKANS